MTFFMSYFFATVNFKMVLEQCGHGYGKPGKVREIGQKVREIRTFCKVRNCSG